MAETLLTPSSIKLYGRVVSSLVYNDDTQPFGNNNFLQEQLSYAPPAVAGAITGTTTAGSNVVSDVQGTRDLSQLGPGARVSGGGISANSVITRIYTTEESKSTTPPAPPAPRGALPAVAHSTTTKSLLINFEIQPAVPQRAAGVGAGVPLTIHFLTNFARIYAFSFEGSIYTLPKPAIFLVFGPGKGIDVQGFGGGRTNTDQAGVVAREWEFSGAGSTFGGTGNVDLRYWEYEKGDFSIRLDTEAGPFEQILLAAAVRAGADMADRSGASLGIRSGASLAGASLSGASVSGASLSGASLSGASLSGASLRGR
jgi:hypothetical protein